MKKTFKKLLMITGCYSLLLAGWVIAMSCFGGGIPDPPVFETIYAAPVAITGTIVWDTDVAALTAAETHAVLNTDDLEEMVTQSYWGFSTLYLQYGVSTTNCTDHDHLTAITNSGGVSAVGWMHDVQWSGTMWFQVVSQCEEDFDSDSNGEGAYWKGEQWYAAFDYPTSPEENIWLDQAYVTNCQFPYDIDPFADEYGCGADDV